MLTFCGAPRARRPSTVGRSSAQRTAAAATRERWSAHQRTSRGTMTGHPMARQPCYERTWWRPVQASTRMCYFTDVAEVRRWPSASAGAKTRKNAQTDNFSDKPSVNVNKNHSLLA